MYFDYIFGEVARSLLKVLDYDYTGLYHYLCIMIMIRLDVFVARNY